MCGNVPGEAYPPRNAPTGFLTGNGVTSASVRGELWKLRSAETGAEKGRMRSAGERRRDAIVFVIIGF